MSKTILISHDDLVTQKLLKLRFEHAGYSVAVANNGQEGLRCLKEQGTDFVLTDDEMPTMNGFSFCKTLKDNPATAQIPIFVLLSNSRIKDSFLALDVTEVIESPIDGGILLKKVRRILLGRSIENYMLKTAQTTSTAEASRLVDSVKRVIIYARSEKLRHLMKELEDKNRLIEFINNEKNILPKTIELSPHIILIDIQAMAGSIKELVKQINDVPHLEARVLLFSYFANAVLANNSALHYHYLYSADKIAAEIRYSLRYLGALNDEAVVQAIKRYLEVIDHEKNPAHR